MKNAYFLILCGGGGERLWPLSRKNRPKQFISFLNGKSLLEQTIDRIAPLSEDLSKIGVVTTDKQKELLLRLVGSKIGFIIDEPASRNTAPAILYSCLKLQEKNKDAVVVFLPADSFVVDNEKYRNYLQSATEYALTNDKIITLGLMPTRPTVSYGYIQADSDDKNIDCGKFYRVLKFHEKPVIEKAREYIQQGDMFWNIGVFIAKVSVFLNEFKNCAPELFLSMQNFLSQKISYQELPNISVDYAVMEKSKNVSLLTCNFEWDDIGNLDTFLTFQKRFSHDSANIINIDGERNLVQVLSEKAQNEKLVAFVGVSDLCLVQDKDVILVAKRDEIEKVKKVLAKIREESLENFL